MDKSNIVLFRMYKGEGDKAIDLQGTTRGIT